MNNFFLIALSLCIFSFILSNYYKMKLSNNNISALIQYSMYFLIFYSIFKIENIITLYIFSIFVILSILLTFLINNYIDDIQTMDEKTIDRLTKILVWISLIPTFPFAFSLPFYSVFPSKITLVIFVIITIALGMLVAISDNLKDIIFSILVTFSSEKSVTISVCLDGLEKKEIKNVMNKMEDIIDIINNAHEENENFESIKNYLNK